MRHGVAATTDHLAPLRPLAIASVIDVGANNGQFALLARHLWPAARIWSFEPLEEAADRFSALFGNDPRLSLFKLALGPEPGEAEIHISKRPDSSSMLAITDHQTAMFPGTEEVATGRVRVERLDALLASSELDRPVLLKIDVQGFELAVLQGCGPLLDHIDYVYCECSFTELYRGQALAHQVVRWLDDRGIVLMGVHNVSHDRHGRAVQADFLFGRRDMAGQ